jgi:acyl-CoA thioesterase-1
VKPAGFLAIVSVVFSGLLVTGCKQAPAAPAVKQNSADVASTQPASPEFKAAPVTTETIPDTRPLLLCFGDSLTAGYGTDPGQSYPDQLQLLLDAKGYRYRVVNLGISGNTSKDGLERIDRVLARHPAIVVVEFGGNDGLRGLPLEQTKANLATIITQLQSAHATVALAGITLPPDYGKDYIAQLVAIYPALAKQYHVPLLPFLLQDVYGVPGDMQDDQTHATAKGNKQVALNVEKLVVPLLKK